MDAVGNEGGPPGGEIPRMLRESGRMPDEHTLNGDKTAVNVSVSLEDCEIQNVVDSSECCGKDENSATNIDLCFHTGSRGGCGEGSDSGVELNGGPESFLAFQRGLSVNSGGYASSCGGFDDSSTTPAMSCDSSLISYSTCEDAEDMPTSMTLVLPNNGDGTSEAGSESSSVTSRDVVSHTKRVSGGGSGSSLGKRRTDLSGSQKTSTGEKDKGSVVSSAVSTSARTRHNMARNPGVSVKPTVGSGGGGSNRREKVSAETSPASISSRTAGGTARTLSSRPTSGSTTVSSRVLTKAFADNSGTSVVRRENTGRNPTKNPALTSRVKGHVISDDGRWPSIAKSHSASSRSRGGSVESQPKSMVTNTSNVGASSHTVMESKASALEKYATLPRRGRRKSPEPSPVEAHARSLSMSRDPSLNRAASLRKQHHARDGTGGTIKSLPPYPRRRSYQKIRIYHETSIQTVLTGCDVEQALAGIGIRERTPLRDPGHDRDVQVDLRDEEIERLELQLKELGKTHAQLELEYQRQKDELGVAQVKLSEEREGRLGEKAELEEIEHRLGVVLCSVKGSHYTAEISKSNYLQELENHVLSSSNIIVKQQREINELQARCRILQRDLEKSLAAQKMLLQQQQENEVESMELQDFLQAEKSTLAEALREAEVEINHHKQQILQRKSDLEQQQEECKHLVRISEQRRQENLALQARLNSLEQRSKDLLLQQGAAVSGAAVALSGLGSRLESLVDQLVTSYDISEKDLEDVIFHNEAYSKSNSSVEASPEKSCSSRTSEPKCSTYQHSSPKRGGSFVAAVISAIQSSFTDRLLTCPKNKEQESSIATQTDSSPDADELLELEKDPCNVVESEEENSNAGISRDSSTSRLANSESLQNLSQAIISRQQCEMDSNVSGTDNKMLDSELFSPVEDFLPTLTLVDQVIDVDNLVTKLLKVLRIIQLENDVCIEELHDERVQLAEYVRREQEAVRNWESIGARLRGELKEAKQQLQQRVQELEETRAQLHMHRELVESLSRDIKKVKLTHQNAELQLHKREEEAERALEQWQKTGELPSPDTLARIVTAKDEIPALKERLLEKELELKEMGQRLSANKQMLTENWHQAALEVRRQYEAIDAALETLHSIQSVVVQCPPLAKLQRDLEETNFHCASSVPIMAPDLNANAPLASLNGTHKHTISGTV